MDAAQEVKSKLDVADIVGEYLTLKPAGSGSFKALCPFHQEKTPSFYVNRPRQSWHCFGCDKGGDLISFVMAMEGTEFREALEHLATKAGIQLPTFDPQKSGERKRLLEVNDLASKFFRATLLASPDAEHARAYAAKRHIDDLTGDLFRIGYAPQSWDALTTALKSKGVTDEEMLKAGLVAKSDRGPGVYDRFRDRLMFSIQDVHGNVVGFTGRLLAADAKEAKYVNTPETVVYRKSAVLYGLDKAKGDIKRQDLAVVVEGNMDVVSSHRAGITNVICSSGTALTEEQLKLVSRFTKNLAIAFDADAAGGAATLRGLDLARSQDFNVKLITLPPEAGKDPDDAVTKDPDLWRRAIADATDVMDWVFRNAFKNRSLSNPEDKKRIAAGILPEIRRIADPIVRDHWVKKLASGLSVGEDALREALRKSGTGNREPGTVSKQARPTSGSPFPAPGSRFPDRVRDLSEQVLAILLKRPELRSTVEMDLTGMLPADLSTLYTDLESAYTLAEQKDLVDILVIRGDRDYQDQTPATLERELKNAISLLHEHVKTSARRQIEEDMRQAELMGDRDRILQLTQRFKELTS
ncbi:DNA primase [Candidatus Uhrbacteria bacterium RIFCSPHIGHO2_12_FULL_60_25]|uniref:DNA primase n=1 Tax=Candidatus Uhrbacteria bacterium RIFCSPHIGHO2_12_FULL_60_25 TaxID=1802399 RepID=A0A1F7UK60_9BACT|nr:MAG: DNA primase [Candidatus Uhrbacteria bacterium RIFCSPHIGHO2_02_FULL_60_44]OGL78114.1 MAG: DNA primase [Candidatus Uhrbacteria bacterium RIFCSPHIGHO2_12_FULL_60_25]